MESLLGGNISWAEAKEFLRQDREENSRNSEKIVYLWEHILSKKPSKLGDEVYLVLEQVCTAAADIYRQDIVESCLQQLTEAFPKSLRVQRLQVLKLEMAGRYDEALKFLDELSKIDETNAAIKKKRIAILKSKGNTAEAIKELIEYLKTFMSDREAWQELSELYLAEQDYNRAAFCLEELILHSPYNHLYHQRYAEIRYTQGGNENLELAKAHYCMAVKLAPNNMRALYGLFLCVSNLAASQKTQLKKKETSKLAAWAAQKIEEKYAEVNTTEISGLLSQLQIT